MPDKGLDADLRMTRIAVLLAAHQGLNWLGYQIDTILAQRGVSVTVVVSVDASSDGTEAYVDELASRHANIHALPHGSRFGTAAANFFRLISEVDADGFDYLSFADQDDLWDEDKLLRAVDQLRSRGADAYSGNVTAFWPDGRRALIHKAQPQREWDFLFEAAGPGCTYVMSHRLFVALQRFVRSHGRQLQSIYLHDWFCYAFARASGFRWWIDPVPKMGYRQHQNNVVGVNRGWRAMSMRLQSVRSGWWLDQARQIAQLLQLERHPFVQAWLNPYSRSGYWALLIKARRCRRKSIDVLFMRALVLLLFLHPPSLSKG